MKKNRFLLGGKKYFTFDRPILWSVLLIQLALAGWFGSHSAQQKSAPEREAEATMQATPALSHTQDPVSDQRIDGQSVQGDAGTAHQRTQAGANNAIAPLNFADYSMLTYPLVIENTSPVAGQLRERAEKSMLAFQHIRQSLLEGDLWHDLHSTPTLDMREYNDRYEVTLCIPEEGNHIISTAMEGNVLAITVEQRDEINDDADLFQRRILLPWPITNTANISTRTQGAALTVSVPR